MNPYAAQLVQIAARPHLGPEANERLTPLDPYGRRVLEMASRILGERSPQTPQDAARALRELAERDWIEPDAWDADAGYVSLDEYGQEVLRAAAAELTATP